MSILVRWGVVTKYPSLGDWETTEMCMSPFWRLEGQGQGTSRPSVWGEPAYWFIDSCLLAVSSQGRRGEGARWDRFDKGLGPINHLRTALPP